MMDSEIIREDIINNQKLVEEYQNGKQLPIDKLNIVITQPRRMAAVSMAARVSR
jgi:HrpA-like RNA helicase